VGEGRKKLSVNEREKTPAQGRIISQLPRQIFRPERRPTELIGNEVHHKGSIYKSSLRSERPFTNTVVKKTIQRSRKGGKKISRWGRNNTGNSNPLCLKKELIRVVKKKKRPERITNYIEMGEI